MRATIARGGYPLTGDVMHRLKYSAVTLLVTAFLVACGGGDNGSDPTPQTTIVVTPATQTRVAGETHQFSATVNGAAPTPGQVVWSSTNTSVATVESATGLATAVAAGTAKIRATVGTAVGEADFTVVSNTAPSANAGADAEVDRSATVTLAGTGTDPQGQAITYKWTQTEGPDVTGGVGYLTGATPTFTAPSTVSVLRFSLVTSDGFLTSTPDEVRVYVLEDKTKALWVSGLLGDDANAGTRAAPFKTIAAAINAASGNGADVYVAIGAYPSVTLASHVSLYGGFADDWHRRWPTTEVANLSVIGDAATRAVVGSGVQDLVVDGFQILAANAGSGSSFGVTLMNSQRVTISSNDIRAGNGAPGAIGWTGANGATGLPGGNAYAEVTPAAGGSGPGSRGGSGGQGGTGSAPATAGQVGQGAGGQGGNPASPPTPGGRGGNGAYGTGGSMGTGGASFGSFSGTNYVASAGAAGASGNPGGGGGGGGGGGYVYVFPIGYNGGGGGGGGAGGAGGYGGGGGTGGGGSFGIQLSGSTEIVVRLNRIATGHGGAGGTGGRGGVGGAGGTGGAGFDPSSTVDGREGGHGGDGGTGGFGGTGGGGGGGPAIGLVSAGGSTFTDSGNSYTLGSGGSGGAPNGAIGVAAPTRLIP